MEKGPIKNVRSLPDPLLSTANFNKAKVDGEKAKKVCREFEALFWQEIFKMMRKTIWGKGWGNYSGAGNEIYQTLMEQEISKTLAQKKGIGIGDLLYKQISKQQKK